MPLTMPLTMPGARSAPGSVLSPAGVSRALSIPSGTRTDSHAVAQALHDLGSALWFGGTVMGVAGVNKSGQDLTQGIDRIRVANSAWRRFGPVEWAGVATVVAAGLRLTSSGRQRLALQQGFGRTGTAKAAVTALGIAATAYSAYSGMKVGRLAEVAHAAGEPVEVTDASIPAPATPPELAKWQRRQRVAQYAVPLLSGMNIVLGSQLVQSYRATSTLSGIARRLMPGR